jgi:hypothetical protein
MDSVNDMNSVNDMDSVNERSESKMLKRCETIWTRPFEYPYPLDIFQSIDGLTALSYNWYNCHLKYKTDIEQCLQQLEADGNIVKTTLHYEPPRAVSISDLSELDLIFQMNPRWNRDKTTKPDMLQTIFMNSTTSIQAMHISVEMLADNYLVLDYSNVLKICPTISKDLERSQMTPTKSSNPMITPRTSENSENSENSGTLITLEKGRYHLQVKTIG